MTPPGTPWTTEPSPLDIKLLTRTFVQHDVRFVFVGGIAAVVHGFSGLTEDADIVPELSDENFGRLASALRALNARVYVAPDRRDLIDSTPPEATDLDLNAPETLRSHLTWRFSTDAGLLDVLMVIDGAGGYREISPNAPPTMMGEVEVLVIGLDDLIEAKATSARSKDLAALDELRRLRDGRSWG